MTHSDKQVQADHVCGHAKLPNTRTHVCERYFHEHAANLEFIIMVMGLAHRIDKRERKILDLVKPVISIEKYQSWQQNIDNSSATEQMEQHKRRYFEMLLCREVDNYLVYISELLADIFRAKPETLRSGEMVRLDTVLRHGTMKDLINELADRRVHELSYSGLKDLSVYFKEKLGLSLFQGESDEQHAVQIIEQRNLIVHARSVVNPLFLRKIPNSTIGVGELLPFGRKTGSHSCY